MRQRGVRFRWTLILTILMMTAPVVFGIGYLWIFTTENRGRSFPIRFDIGVFFGRTYHWSPLAKAATMVHNRWYWMSYSHSAGQKLKLNLYVIDPEPQSQAGVDFDPPRMNPKFVEDVELSSQAAIQFPYFSVVGDEKQLYLVGKAGEVIQLQGNRLVIRTTKFAKQLNSPQAPSNNELMHCVVADGKLLAIVKQLEGTREVFQFANDTWVSVGHLALLDTSGVWLDSKHRQLFIPLSPQPIPASGSGSTGPSTGPIAVGTVGKQIDSGTIKVVTIDSKPFLFWRISNRLLCRQGLDISPSPQADSHLSGSKSSTDETVSALTPTNVVGVASDWTAVSDNLTDRSNWFPVAVGGKPAAIVIDESKRGHPLAKAFRFEGGEWTEFASIDLLFASSFFNSGSLDDGSTTYLSAVTSMGNIKVVALEPDGFRQTTYRETSRQRLRLVDLWNQYEFNGYLLFTVMLIWFQLTGVVLAIVSTILMSRDSVQFDFGKQTADLASIWSRACARVIDSSLLLAVTSLASFGLYQSLRPDWISVFDAWEIQVYDDANILALSHLCMGSLLALAVSAMLVVMLQGLFGVTPGKWICGLRVVRTTLRPCHFARSLYREILLFIDSAYLLSWAPGILNIAFSSHRQRIGDFAADTIVIRARSIRAIDQNST